MGGMVSLRRALALVLLPLSLVVVAPAARADDVAAGASGADPRIVRASKALFGTVAEALAPASTDADRRVVATHLEAAFAEMARVEALLDDAQPASAIARVNAAAGGSAVVVDPETFAVLDELQRVAKVSKGSVDVTAAPYAELWRFGAGDGRHADAAAAQDGGVRHDGDERSAPPAKDALAAKRALVGYQDLVLDGAARTVALRRPGSSISLAPFAKAYALDRAAAVLESRNVADFLLSAGGDLVVRGKKGNKPWMVGVQDPRAAGHFAAFAAQAGAVATCGDYERFFFDRGARLHDVLDPKTGLPATKVRSVTVTSKDAVAAEALARAAFVLGPKEGIALIERLKGAEAVLVTTDNRVLVTKGLRGVVQYSPPTDGL